jgi:hypothetical protein
VTDLTPVISRAAAAVDARHDRGEDGGETFVGSIESTSQ